MQSNPGSSSQLEEQPSPSSVLPSSQPSLGELHPVPALLLTREAAAVSPISTGLDAAQGIAAVERNVVAVVALLRAFAGTILTGCGLAEVGRCRVALEALFQPAVDAATVPANRLAASAGAVGIFRAQLAVITAADTLATVVALLVAGANSVTADSEADAARAQKAGLNLTVVTAGAREHVTSLVATDDFVATDNRRLAGHARRGAYEVGFDEAAGATPIPACAGAGGTFPTVLGGQAKIAVGVATLALPAVVALLA